MKSLLMAGVCTAALLLIALLVLGIALDIAAMSAAVCFVAIIVVLWLAGVGRWRNPY
jgi:high-affinity Fe2+/Pb2+ permease